MLHFKSELNMKQFLKYKCFAQVASCLIVSVTSCGNYLDVVPDGVATIENAFTSRTTAEKYLFTCYSYMPSHGSYDANTFYAGDEFWAPFPQTPQFFAISTFAQLGRNNQSIISPRLNYWDGEGGGKPLLARQSVV